MQKEKIITIAVGLLIGVIAAGFFFFSTKIKPGLNKVSVEVPSNTKSNKQSAAANFTINSPEDNSISTESALKVSGTGENGATIIIVCNASEYKVVVENQKFEVTIKLEEGENRIQAISVVPGFDPKVINHTVTLDI